MKIIVKSTMDELQDKEIHMTTEQVEALKMADVIEVDMKRFRMFEMVFDLDTMQFLLWLDKE